MPGSTAGAEAAPRPRAAGPGKSRVPFPIIGQVEGAPRQASAQPRAPRRRSTRAAPRSGRAARLVPGRARPTAGCGSAGRSSRSAAATAPIGSSGLVRTRFRSFANHDRMTHVTSFAGPLLGRRLTRGGPGSEHRGHYAGRWPVPASEAPQRVLAAAASVCARPVVGRWQPPVALAPLQHRRDHQLPRPALHDRAGMAALAVRVRVAFAVAGLRVGAAATAHADVAGLDRLGLFACWVLGA